jgi:superfamily II DNA or RNA helicase
MPDQAPPPGLYQQLLTERLEQQLNLLASGLYDKDGLDPQEAPRLLARHLAGLARIALEHLSGGSTPEHQLALVNQLVGLLQSQAPRAISTGDLLHPSARLLSEIRSKALLPGQVATIRPLIPLADSTLLVNASGEPSVGQALIHEIPSAQRIDLLCAFIKWSGLRLLQPALFEFLQAQPRRQLRVLTTVYLGATDRRALDWLVAHGAEVRISYDTRRTRLHAKAWLFHRPGLTGSPPASTAYIGSSNLSTAALHDGLEWNVRLSAHDNEGILAKFQAAFESYWEEGEFEPYRASEIEQRRFDRAAREESVGDSATDTTPLSFFDIRPYAYQQEILDKLSAERSLHGRWRNLVVAATGTGKTVIAALDYARQGGPGHPSLLFVAHRREILQQSLATFRQVLRDGSFGELLVDGQRPSQWRHVFASVQSLAGLDPADLAPDTFAVVIVDEFHHAAAASYERWLRHLAPVLLLGLTATPERTGGEDILHWFDGRIAAELRLWSALEQGLLTPFHYFGLHDGTDLSRIEWRRNGYATEALSNLYTADDARLRLILHELADKITNLDSMRALGFCVSVEHAHWMARKFVAAGLRAAALDASSPREQRAEQIRRLRAGELQILFAVDLFNEGLDIPEIDTVLFLRPTESAIVFLQQLGRGLRLHPSKSCLTVLDFIGQAHRSFRYDLRYRALLGGTRDQLEQQIKEGFPFLPAGCSLQLDRVSSERVLANLRESLPTRRPQLLAEARRLGRCSLAALLEGLGMELEEFYKVAGSWALLQRELGWVAAGAATGEPSEDEKRLGRGIAGGLLHLDDPERMRWLVDQLQMPIAPDPAVFDPATERSWRMLMTQLWGSGRQHLPLAEALMRLWAAADLRAELVELFELLLERTDHLVAPLAWPFLADGEPYPPVPLGLHGRYSRAEVFAAFGLLNEARPFPGREGVFFDEATQCDVFFITLKKSERLFSPTTRYNDYAISPWEFHWESQSLTRETSATGQRYIHHVERGSRVMLFVREESKRGGVTLPFLCLGFADYVSHEGERPMAIRWRLQRPIPAAFVPELALAV